MYMLITQRPTAVSDIIKINNETKISKMNILIIHDV